MNRETVYLALGDSTGVGLGALRGGGYPQRLLRRLQDVRPGARLVNLSESGATTQEVLADQVPRALRERPTIISLCIGINDVSMQAPEEAFSMGLEEIVTRLRSLSAPIVIANIPDLALAPAVQRVPSALYERRIEVFNEHVEATAARHRLSLVDLFALRETLPTDSRRLFCSDGFHPSAEGYEQWAEAMWPAFISSLPGETAAQLG